MSGRSRALRRHPDLRERPGCVLVMFLLLFGGPSLGFLGWSARTGLELDEKDPRLAATIAAGLFGAALLVTGSWIAGRYLRFERRSGALYHRRRGVQMRLRAIRNDRGALFLELHALGDPHMREPRIRIQAQTPAWDTIGLDGQIVEVYMDDDPSGPVVVETERGIIWPDPLARRENRVEGKLG